MACAWIRQRGRSIAYLGLSWALLLLVVGCGNSKDEGKNRNRDRPVAGNPNE